MIEVQNLSKKYQEHQALDGVSFSVSDGEILGIVGKSGSGKSTLLRLLNLMEQPTEGQILIDGKLTNQLTKQQVIQYKQKIGVVFQQYNLLANKTVKANVALPLTLLHQKDAKRVREVLDFVGVTSKSEAYPAELSGGEKQRVAIARALVRQPEILLCDEATSSLDEENTDSVLRLLQRIHQEFGITIFFVSHELDSVKKLCNRVLVLEAGKLLGIVENQPEPIRNNTSSYLDKVKGRLAK
ncbi:MULTISPECIES: ATP-binding cassette domain-containing protein [unclassified Enterococcus]|uniref:methionine ABC transporter ATP-binding protein n=1 Tax=unclassified Enterococcus TaxID=2608891 RepID=UPI001554561B|nr:MULTISPECIES: ATP-binding cassette domain-containing protein [unclassified Enterococcus]MBS7576051.1 ATP-binding cassette domain-containing protein [Enterococcus sp. MMGLQ5-2]MBS7583284.1 ATP-binding cassette domain-containing protein [Enterococcus sp. MMGLQ5-1]NPD11144.1 ATP-binding cassette domain-containing protein [Enterococcus sp. MMGLQ5-1]NPD35887.1 ATP-binding cassette domain-containing protein [Enterococcus sp. MMGLQ5-2]